MFNNLSIRAKLWSFTALSALILVVVMGSLLWTNYDSSYEARKQSIRDTVETATAVLKWAHAQEVSGAMTREQAQAAALDSLRAARYGKEEYFWVNDMTPRVLMHPMNQKLNGQDVSGVRDPNGNPLFVRFVELVRKEGAGYWAYLWPKPGLTEPVQKESYVAGFQPWGWVLGSGLYMDDLRSAFVSRALTAAGFLAVLLAALLMAARSVQRSVTGGLAQATDAARSVASGDLASQIATDRRDEVGELLSAMAAMQTSLADVVSTVRENSDSVATASAEIAQGNTDLSQRTEEQAAALEQTAATMDELSSTVRNNADSARQANQLAASASTSAKEGGRVVGEVVGTMRGIQDSSKKISEIIGVIDGIAFQTNILALNAAVEAARAGEQGRGFAVVAGEVRNLAQRSAEAAKEIKELITASVDQVEQGTALVDRAGSTMEEIVAGIQRVTDIVGEISMASEEQSRGVTQVGQAVSQMDEVTQQNAALVEESTAAAESLRQQAQQLVQVVAVFKTGTRRASPAVAPTRAATQHGVERRGPNRATNVTRPAFGKAKPTAKAASTPSAVESAPARPAAEKTGTDDWESF